MRTFALTFALAATALPAAGAPYCWKPWALPPQVDRMGSAASDGARWWFLRSESRDVFGEDRLHAVEWDGAKATELPPIEHVVSGVPQFAAGPALSWIDNASGGHAAVARWTGKAWQRCGNPGGAFPKEESPAGLHALAARRGGQPIVAWRHSPTSEQSYPLLVAAWDGARWQPLGAGLALGSDIYALGEVLAVDEHDRPWIAFADGSERAGSVRVMRWSGAAWEDVGGTAGGALGGAQKAEYWDLSLVTLPGGGAVVAWRAQGNPVAGVARWDGTRWLRAPPPLEVAGRTREPSGPRLAVTPDGGLYLEQDVADATEYTSVFVQQWTTNGWQWVLQGAHLEATEAAELVRFESAGPSRLRLFWAEKAPHAIEAGPCRPGETPAAFPEKRSLRSTWPKTVAEAVDRLVAGLDPESVKTLKKTPRDDLVKFHLGWGMGIRNEFGMWAGNDALLKDCGTTVPDDCSMTIMERVWDRLNEVKRRPW